MREIKKWRTSLVARLRKEWPRDARLSPSEACDVELLLTLIVQVFPELPATAGWALLTGYPFPHLYGRNWTPAHNEMLSVARHLLPYYRGQFRWQRAVQQYQGLPAHLRGYDVHDSGRVTQRIVTIAANRLDVYHAALVTAPSYKTTPLRRADAGEYRYAAGRQQVSVVIPPEMITNGKVPRHSLAARTSNPPILISWADLIDTARWMDQKLAQTSSMGEAKWEHSLSRVRLELVDKHTGKLLTAEKFSLQGMMNFVGMVSSGKTTLITVLTVWLARNGHHITLIVGDVMNALDRAEILSQLGIKVAPILGASNRRRHIDRLHRMQHARCPQSPLAPDHKGFDWLSTVCSLSGLVNQPITMDLRQRPCLNLHPVSLNQEGEEGEAHACPIFDRCDFHRGQRELVDAQVWIATPASLVYTQVAPQINQERIRFAELVYRHSHVVLVDEADQVQAQLDHHFSPSQTLAGPSDDAWFTQLSQLVTQRLNQQARAQLSEPGVEAWCSAHDLVHMATNRVYGLLLQEPALQAEVAKDYFTAWTLLERIARRLGGAKEEECGDHAAYLALMQQFETFIDDPLGERVDSDLATLAQRSITHDDKEISRQRVLAWIKRKHNTGGAPKDTDRLALTCEFALVLAVLSNRLHRLLRDWKQAEAALQLDSAGSAVFQQPPEDYSAVIPVSPMGNVLAFQYVNATDLQPGDLRFFRCMGVGRWLLLHLHELFSGDGIAGPHVALFSGTSWAGTSPSYHIQLPVDGILHAPAAEVEAIAAHSRFIFNPVFEDGAAIKVSGLRGQQRRDALRKMLQHFACRRGVQKDKPSLFEAERDSLPPYRQRILLLVGSYDEVEFVVDSLHAIRPEWKGEILGLVSDDDEVADGPTERNALRRGLVHQFAGTGAWLLVAPLLAVERGHNIMNEHAQAAIGSAYFLIRPHPRPDDLNYAIQSINRWAVDQFGTASTAKKPAIENQMEQSLLDAARNFRREAFIRWRYLLRLPMIYSTLPNSERVAVTWSQLVTIWQVIGRLVRGGSPARVFFCDAAFAPAVASLQHSESQPERGLLANMRGILTPYFDNSSPNIAEQDRVLVRTLYGPLYRALQQMKGFPE